MVDRHQHNIAFFGEIFPVRNGVIARTDPKPTAVQPKHHRSFLSVIQTLSPDVDGEQSLFVHGIVRRPAVDLHRDGAEPSGIAYAIPAIGRLRRHKAFGLRVWDAFKRVYTVVNTTRNRT